VTRPRWMGNGWSSGLCATQPAGNRAPRACDRCSSGRSSSDVIGPASPPTPRWSGSPQPSRVSSNAAMSTIIGSRRRRWIACDGRADRRLRSTPDCAPKASPRRCSTTSSSRRIPIPRAGPRGNSPGADAWGPTAKTRNSAGERATDTLQHWVDKASNCRRPCESSMRIHLRSVSRGGPRSARKYPSTIASDFRQAEFDAYSAYPSCFRASIASSESPAPEASGSTSMPAASLSGRIRASKDSSRSFL